ncbi:MAG: SRPBCC family protein [Caldimonas sp.]
MRIVKWLAGVLVGLVVLLLAVGFFLPGTFKVVRSTEIAAPAEKVYALVADPRGWKQWSAWNKRDPQMQITYSGPPSGAGAKWEWKSASQGDGAMTFTAAEPARRVAFDLYFPDFGTTSRGELSFEPKGSATRVTWTMNGDMGKNPLYHWFALAADGMVGKDFEEGLAGLKAAAEKP